MAPNDEVEKINRALTRTVERVVTKISLDIVANLKAAPSEGGTPIDTSWASSNWIPAIGRDRKGTAGQGPGGPGRDTKTGQFKSRSQSSGDVGSAKAEQGAGEASLLVYKLPQGAVFISNYVPYIGLLNTTRPSPQAAPGFVERAIDKALTVDLRG